MVLGRDAGRRPLGMLLALVVVVAGLAGVAVQSAGATHEPWGFYRISTVVGPGDLISPYGLAPERPWRAGDQSGIDDGIDACAQDFNPERFRSELLDSAGARVGGPWGAGNPPYVPSGLAPGTYTYRLDCAPGGHPVFACAPLQIQATPRGPGGDRERGVEPGDPLVRSRCPVSAGGVVFVAAISARALLDGVWGTLFPAGTPGSATATSTTTTTRPTPAAPGADPSADTSAPTVGVSAEPSLIGNAGCAPDTATVTWSSSDDVGVGSVTVSWSGAGGSGSTTGGPSGSVAIGPFPDNNSTVVVTAVARDAAGNTGSASTSVSVQCPG